VQLFNAEDAKTVKWVNGIGGKNVTENHIKQIDIIP
jgi:hypothetical protein